MALEMAGERSAFFLLVILATCRGYPGGGPWKACFDMVPKHKGIQQQTADPPFEITLSKNNYSPGENITVTLKGKTATDLFRGLVIGAHPVTGDTENAVGKFVSIPYDSKGISWYAEAQNEPNCVTHNSNGQRKSSTFVWQAPTLNYGNLIFTAAVVKSFNVFWGNVTSSVLTSNSVGSVPPFSASIQLTSTLTTIAYDVDGCGRKYGCILYPRYCKGKGCEIIVQFSTIATTPLAILEIKMMAISSGYLSMAVSDDKKMGNDFTITCGISSNQVYASLQNAYNPAYNYERHRVYNYSNVRMQYNNERIYCSFQRPFDTSITRVKVNSTNFGTYSVKNFDLSKSRYVFLGTGPLYEGLESINKHPQDPVITTSTVDFRSKNIYYASAMSILVKMHALCMAIAWMLMAAIGTTIASNYKNVIVKMACGAKLWFQLHLGIMSTCVILTAIGLTLIFVHGWRARANAHGIVGLIGIAFMGVQVIMGIARPDPSHPRRVVFYWAHFLVGNLVFCLLVDTILISTLLPHLPPIYRRNNMIVIIVWIVLLVFWVVGFMVLRILGKKRENQKIQADKDKDNAGDDVKMETSSHTSYQLTVEKPEEDSEKLNRIMLLLLGLYIVFLLVFFSIFVSFIAIY